MSALSQTSKYLNMRVCPSAHLFFISNLLFITMMPFLFLFVSAGYVRVLQDGGAVYRAVLPHGIHVRTNRQMSME